jgi:hypothetical protein
MIKIPVPGNDRIIVIFGMAHSGTTILAYVMSQHPKIVLHTNGPSHGSVVLESYSLHRRHKYDVKLIQQFVAAHPNNYCLFKQPHSEIAPDWFARVMPDAHYYCMMRPFDEIVHSWNRSRRENHLWLRKPHLQKDVYNLYHKAALEFQEKSGVKHFRIINLPDLRNDPAGVMALVAADLGIDKFDTSMIGTCNIKEILKRRKNRPLEATPSMAQPTTPYISDGTANCCEANPSS